MQSVDRGLLDRVVGAAHAAVVLGEWTLDLLERMWSVVDAVLDEPFGHDVVTGGECGRGLGGICRPRLDEAVRSA